jgi:hydrogenase-1 operon protein HyaF
MNKIDIPIEISPLVGPGSQPADSDGAEMTFMQMPSGMFTYEAPMVPEAEEITGLEDAVKLTRKIEQGLQQYKVGGPTLVFELNDLDRENRQFFDQLLGEGEVSVQCTGNINALIQESVLAGVWRVQYVDEHQAIIRDTIEIADIPGLISELTFAEARKNVTVADLQIPDDVYNAAPLLVEINDKLPEYKPGNEPYVINLSLLPHTEQDLVYLSDQLGIGPIIILSRGYGNCRISSTGTANVWWVQYYNSQETLILNTIEISKVPEVACASQEDIDDSAQRLNEILSIYE